MAKNRFTARLSCALAFVLAFTVTMIHIVPAGSGPWWDVVPEPEIPSSYYDSIFYSEIAPKLREIQLNTDRVDVEVIGQSAGGRNMFLVTIAAIGAEGRFGHYKELRKLMITDPDRALQKVDEYPDLKVPVFISASTDGNEYPGVDAAIRLIEKLAYDNTDEEVQDILENVILLVNVVQNPDGRVMGTSLNANGFDLNRDFIAQSQPETRALVSLVAEWNPMVFLDLHLDVDDTASPMLIEPATPPHNPNYEYDLYLKWAIDQAQAMEAELIANTDETEAVIPFRDSPDGWDDWAPICGAKYAMFHGAYGHTLESPYRDERGVDAHYWAVWGALKYVVDNKKDMIKDQIEIYRRGYLGLSQVPIPEELLAETPYDQFNELTTKDDFPAAYIIPADAPFQQSSHQAVRLVEFLLSNDVQVEKSKQAFTVDGINYPEDTYIVWMDQPKRGLANTNLEEGFNVADLYALTLYPPPPAAWSHPLLWGVSTAVMEVKMNIDTRKVEKVNVPKGSVEDKSGGAYAYLPTSLAAYKATNELLASGIILYRATTSFEDSGRDFGSGTFIILADPSLANELANDYRLNIYAIAGPPESSVLMTSQRIAVFADEGVTHCLSALGFDYEIVSTDDLNSGVISGYNVFLNRGLRWSSLNVEGQASLTAWFAAGGDYVGLAYRGRAIDFAKDAGFLDTAYGYISGNAIVKVGYDPDDSVAAGFREDGYAYVYRSVWFTAWPEGTEISACLDGGDFLVSGFWPDWQASGANGMPLILHGASGSADVTLIGIDPTFRGHPENTFRIVANAIYNGLD